VDATNIWSTAPNEPRGYGPVPLATGVYFKD